MMLGTDVPLKHGTPKAVSGLIVFMFLWGLAWLYLSDAFRVIDLGDYWEACAYHYDSPSLFNAITAIISHGSFQHWLGNSMYLWVYGSILEDRIGPKKFLAYFWFCGFFCLGLGSFLNWAGGYLDWLSYFHNGVKTMGASGAIAGIMGMASYRFDGARVRFVTFLGLTPIRYGIPLGLMTGLFFLNEFLFTVLAGQGFSDGVDHLAHFFGFLGGMLIAYRTDMKGQAKTEALWDMARGRVSVGAYSLALENYHRLRARVGDDPLLHEEIAFCHDRLSETGMASKGRFHRADALHHYQLAMEKHLDRGQDLRAIEILERILGPFQRTEIREALLLRTEAAARELKRPIVAQDRPMDDEVRAFLSQEFRKDLLKGGKGDILTRARKLVSKLGMPGLELKDLEAVRDLAHASFDSRMEQAALREMLRRGDDAQARDALNRLQVLTRDSKDSHHIAALAAHAEASRPGLYKDLEVAEIKERAAKDAEKGREKAKADCLALLAQAKALQASGKNPEACEKFRDAMDLVAPQSWSLDALETCAQAALAAKRKPQAERALLILANHKDYSAVVKALQGLNQLWWATPEAHQLKPVHQDAELRHPSLLQDQAYLSLPWIRQREGRMEKAPPQGAAARPVAPLPPLPALVEFNDSVQSQRWAEAYEWLLALDKVRVPGQLEPNTQLNAIHVACRAKNVDLAEKYLDALVKAGDAGQIMEGIHRLETPLRDAKNLAKLLGPMKKAAARLPELDQRLDFEDLMKRIEG